MNKTLLISFLLLFGFFSGKSQYMKKITKSEYNNFNLTGEEKDWIGIVNGKVSLKLLRTKIFKIDEMDTLYYFKDYVILAKKDKKLMFKDIHRDFMPLINDDPYTIHFMENLITFRKWYNLYMNNRPEFAEKVMKFYNMSEKDKRKLLYK